MGKSNLGLAWLATGVGMSSMALAQNPAVQSTQIPDAGKLQQDIERELTPLQNPSPTLPAPQEVDTTDFPGEASLRRTSQGSLFVKRFRITGARLVPEGVLLSALESFTNKALTFTELTEASARLRQVYREQGFFARALIPEQKVVDGEVAIKVIEASLTAVEVQAPADLSSEQLQGMALYGQPDSKTVGMDQLRRQMAIINEQPGVLSASATVFPDEKALQAQTMQDQPSAPLKLKILAETAQSFNGQVLTDNYGGDSAKGVRLVASGTWNNPIGHLDQLQASGLLTEETRYARLGYNMPLGYSGLRGGVYASDLRYQLRGDYSGFRGSATQYGLDMLYPLVRQNSLALTLDVNAEHNHVVNNSPAGNLNNRVTDTLSLGLAVSTSDQWLGRAENNLSLTYTLGRANYGGNPADLSNDQKTAQASGPFAYWRLNLARLHSISDSQQVFLNLVGQRSGRNLPSTEKIGVTGAGGVRAYSSAEAGGDQALLAQLEYRWAQSDRLKWSLFYDAARVQVNRKPWDGSDDPNRLWLKGVGVGMNLQISKNVTAKLELASPIGENPRRQKNGDDVDGRHSRIRGWLSISMRF